MQKTTFKTCAYLIIIPNFTFPLTVYLPSELKGINQP